MWTQIFSLNTEKVLQSVNMLKERLEEFASFLQRGDLEMVCRILEEAKGTRVMKDEGD
jgi:prephenate dehydrogenase